MQSAHTPLNSASGQRLTTLPSFYDNYIVGYDTFANNYMIHRYDFGSSETANNSVVSKSDPRILCNVPSSPSDFISSPASDSSTEEEIGTSSKTIKPQLLTSSTNSAAQARSNRLSASSNVDLESLSSSTVSTPTASSVPILLRRSLRKRRPNNKHESKDEVLETGPATRLRPRRKLTPVEKKEAQDLKEKGPNFCQWIPEITLYPARPDFSEIEFDEEDSCTSGNRTNSTYPIPESKNQVVAKWTDKERKKFLASYLRHGKAWNLVGPTCKKTTKQCVEYYYYTKHSSVFRQAKAMRKEYLERVGKLHCVQKDIRHVQYLLRKSVPEPGHKKGRKKKSGR